MFGRQSESTLQRTAGARSRAEEAAGPLLSLCPGERERERVSGFRDFVCKGSGLSVGVKLRVFGV